jgi:hypothetical protein
MLEPALIYDFIISLDIKRRAEDNISLDEKSVEGWRDMIAFAP